MKILYYILAFAMGYFFRKYGQAHKKHDELDSHAEELIRREQETETSAILKGASQWPSPTMKKCPSRPGL